MNDIKVGIYLRLSIKDDKSGNESNSIINQQHIIESYLTKQEEFIGVTKSIYCDDGFTGTNFERPQVKQLMEDIKTKKINCVIVKDFSRFGRNYIDVGNYIEKIFPFLGVRFISVSDDYDSEKNVDSAGFITAFKSIIADVYSKELSKKVKVNMVHAGRQKVCG